MKSPDELEAVYASACDGEHSHGHACHTIGLVAVARAAVLEALDEVEREGRCYSDQLVWRDAITIVRQRVATGASG